MALSGGALCGLLALWLVLLPRTARTGAAEGQGAELAALLLMLLFCGALWALVGMTLSALTDSRYIAYASPFVLFYLLVILYERYYDGLFVLYPREWLDPSPRWVYGRAGVAVLLARARRARGARVSRARRGGGLRGYEGAKPHVPPRFGKADARAARSRAGRRGPRPALPAPPARAALPPGRARPAPPVPRQGGCARRSPWRAGTSAAGGAARASRSRSA